MKITNITSAARKIPGVGVVAAGESVECDDAKSKGLIATGNFAAAKGEAKVAKKEDK